MIRNAISLRGVRKSYRDHLALDGVDLEVEPGTIAALLGPNGSGKSTTVGVLSTVLRADAGRVVVGGYDASTNPVGIRSCIGVTGQLSAVDALLTGRENLRLMADLHHLDRREGTRRAELLLEDLDLLDAADRPVSTYSGGMYRRLDLALTLIGRPRVLFLDEPTTGLDPRSRRTVWDLVRGLVADGVTVLLTTQYLAEADALADRVHLLDQGRIVAEGTAAELKRRVPGAHVRLELPDAGSLAQAASALARLGATADEDSLVLRVPSGGTAGDLRALLAGAAVPDDALLAVHTPDLDDVFLTLTGAPR
jgi:ABC-2 type transport system ATP-binding protein